jgi:phenylacetate-CoA ligase
MNREAVMDSTEPIETASLDELRTLQLARLQDIVRTAYQRVPHYKSRFDAAGVHPGDLRLEDLTKFPLTTKEDLRQNYPFGMFAVPMQQIVRIHASSGTTGKPTVVGYTRNDIETWSRLMARSIRAAGGTASDKIHVAYGYGLFTGGLGAHYGGEYLGAVVIPVGGGFTERQVQIINDFKPEIIMVTPSYMLAIADELDRQGIDTRACSLRLGIFGAEPWGEGMRAELERRLGLQALDIYGLSEIIGPGVAQECADWTPWRTGAYHAHQGSHAGHSLPHPRPDPVAARDEPRHAPDRPHQRSQRRHADHPRRQRFSVEYRSGTGEGR